MIAARAEAGDPGAAHHVPARAQEVLHHRVFGGQRQPAPLRRGDPLRGAPPARGAQLRQPGPDEPVPQRLPLRRPRGLRLQPGPGVRRGGLPPAEPRRARAPGGAAARAGRAPALLVAQSARAVCQPAAGPVHLLPLAAAPVPVPGPQVPRWVFVLDPAAPERNFLLDLKIYLYFLIYFFILFL